MPSNKISLQYLKSISAVLLFASTLLYSTFASAQDFRVGNPSRLGFDVDRLDVLDASLQSYIDENRVAGSVSLVLKDGRIVYSSAKGMRDIDAGDEMQTDSIFRIASQTKAIVSTAIMMLQERGELLISDALSKYFPAWATTEVAVEDGNEGYTLEPLARPITLRDLLTHTSGIGYGGFLSTHPANEEWTEAGISGWYLNKNIPIATTVSNMARLPQEAQPGEKWIYGYNIDILGAVVEKASGMSLADFLRTEIFEPLNMQDTHFYLPLEKVNRLTVVYQPDGIGGIEPVPSVGSMLGQGEYMAGSGVNYSGGAGLLSTANDYAKFLQMTLNGGELNGTRLLSPKTIELMTTNHVGEIPCSLCGPGVGFGLGFSVLEDLGARGTLGTVGEYAWGGAYHSTYWVDPEENLVVVYLTQLLQVGDLDDSSKLRSGIYSAIVE